MKIFNSVVISVFVKPEDDLEQFKESMKELVPLDLKKEKLQVKDSKAEGFEEREIHILELRLEKDRHVNEFFENFMEKLTQEQKETLLSQLDSRVDEDGKFFVRIDKPHWILDKNIVLIDSGDCYHLKFDVAAFPKKRDIALQILTKVFKPEK
jgi:RNA binding exosome subunit